MLTIEEYGQLTIEEKALLMQMISSDDNFDVISIIALNKSLNEAMSKILNKEKEHGKEKESDEE